MVTCWVKDDSLSDSSFLDLLEEKHKQPELFRVLFNKVFSSLSLSPTHFS